MAGLHKDGSHYGLASVDVHVRRLIWHHLCFLDIRSLDAMGPPAQIRSDDFDTRLPFNVDDQDLGGLMPVDKDAEHWTDVTFTIIKFECINARRQLMTSLSQLRKKQTTIAALLRETEEWRLATEKRYRPLIDESVPIQSLALLLIQIYANKAIIHTLALYVVFAPQKLPERLRDVVWSAGIRLSQYCIELETSPRYKDWTWYSGAYHQWHIALLLIAEVMQHKDRPEVDQIWNVLDYVFEIPEGLNRQEKAGFITYNASTRIEQYKKHRKSVIPLEAQRKLGPSTEDDIKRAKHPPSEPRRSSGLQPLHYDTNRKSSPGSSSVSSPNSDWHNEVRNPISQTSGPPLYFEGELGSTQQNYWPPYSDQMQNFAYGFLPAPSPGYSATGLSQHDHAGNLDGIDIDMVSSVRQSADASRSRPRNPGVASQRRIMS